MKRTIAGILTMTAVLSLTACGTDSRSTSSAQSSSTAQVAESAQSVESETTVEEVQTAEEAADSDQYPADFSDWTAENMIQYLTDEGVFTNDSWFYNMDADALAGTGISYSCTYMSDDSTIAIMFNWFDPKSEDSAVADHLAYVRENKTTTEATGFVPVDHLIGGFAFTFSMNADIDVTNAANDAYEKLVSAYGVTPEY